MVPSEDYYRKMITENIYLHFFNREIYRGIYGERIERIQIDHSDILATILLCGYNTLFASYSAYHETLGMLTQKGELFRKLTEYNIIKVCGEALNPDMILEHKQEIYYHDRDKYPGYYNEKEIRRLQSIMPGIVKPDVTDRIEALFLEENWDKILRYAPSDIDARIIGLNKELILEVIKNRGNKAITKSIFNDYSVDKRLPNSVGRTLSGIYMEDYQIFSDGDIVTGIPGLKEYDNLAKHFPCHDYEVLKEILIQIGFPRLITLHEFNILLKHYYSQEHMEFALKLQRLLYLLYDFRKNKSVKLPIEYIRVYFLPVIREKMCCLKVNSIDFSGRNFFEQSINNIELAISVLRNVNVRKGCSITVREKKVFVVTGRNEKLRLSIFSLLRALKLEPMEWMDVIESAGQPSAYLNDAIKNSIDEAGAVVVIMAPEEDAHLVKKYQSELGDENSYLQPRPNVIFEAGLALGMKEEKTIILQFGNIRIFSDILGKHILKYKGKDRELQFKNDLFRKLQIAGCNCNAGNDYYSINVDYES